MGNLHDFLLQLVALFLILLIAYGHILLIVDREKAIAQGIKNDPQGSISGGQVRVNDNGRIYYFTLEVEDVRRN